MKQWIFLSFTLLFTTLFSFTQAQTTGNININGKSTDLVDLKAKKYTLEFPIEATTKPKLMGKLVGLLNKDLGYTIIVKAKKSTSCDAQILFSFDGSAPSTNLQNLAKNNKPLIADMDGSELHDELDSYLKRCPCQNIDLELELYTHPTADKLMSTAALKVTDATIAAFNEKENQRIIEFFTSGLGYRAIKDTKAEKMVESHMEKKWVEGDITTVHIADMRYTNLAETELRIEGFYIEYVDGGCQHNSFYCDAKKSTNGNFFITFFNSMDAPRKMDCTIAKQFKNL